MKALANFYQSITGVALPSSDEAQLYNGRLTRVPRVNGTTSSSFQRELEAHHRAGRWHCKVQLLPDVGKFEIELLPFNPALLANGIVARYPSNITLYSNRNARMNRFLAYQQLRLYNSRTNPDQYWRIAQRFVKSSNCYLTVCMYGIDRNLYRFETQDKVRQLIHRLNTLRGNNPININHIAGFKTYREITRALNPCVMQRRYIEFFRIYIPKPSGGERPLGVPTLAWRVYMRMWLLPIMGFTSDRIPSNFHGFIPQRGTGTAWKSILLNVIGHTNIYEIDFKSFFPSVKTDMLGYFMNSVWHLPPQVCYFFYQMNNSLPHFDDPLNLVPNEVKWSPAHQDVFASDMAIRNMFKTWKDSITKVRILDNRAFDAVNQFNAPNLNVARGKAVVKGSQNRFGSISISMPVDDIAAWIEAQTPTRHGTHEEQVFRGEYDIRFRGGTGLPQGSPLSPYLSILYLNEVLHLSGMPDDVKFLFYADDGIFYSNSYESLSGWLNRAFFQGSSSPQSFGYYNISLSIDKSGWVRKSGEWLKPLKFLGLLYYPETKGQKAALVAKTRSGKSELAFTKEQLMNWSYGSSLVGETRTRTIEGRLSLLRRFRPTPVTRAFIFYYESLLNLHRLRIPFAHLENLYLWSTVSRRGAFDLIAFVVSGAYRLDSRENINTYLKCLQEGYEVLEVADPVSLENLEAFLNMGYYEGSEGKLATVSSRLVSALNERAGVYAPSPISVAITERSLFDSLLSAAHFLGFDFDDQRFILLRSDFDRYFQRYLKRLWYPLNLLAFNRFGIHLEYITGHTDPGNKDPDHWKVANHISRYLKRHTFKNFANSRYFGLLMSRLYLGSYNVPTPDSDTSYHCTPGSIGSHLAIVARSKQIAPDVLSIYTGSSYGFHEIVRMASQMKLTSRSKVPFHLFSEGFLSSDSWSKEPQLSEDD